MALKKYRPITPGQRRRSVSTFDEITSSVPEKSLIGSIKKNSGGRNHTGKMTVRNIGGGHKKRYRIIDFKRDKDNIPAVVNSIQYDPNRSARIALLFYVVGEIRYIIAPDKLKVGQTVMSGETVEPVVGNNMQLKNMPLGAVIHNIEMQPGKGGALARSAGTYAQLTGKEGKYVIVKMPSGEIRKILAVCRATVGAVGNSDHGNIILGIAGRNRWLGRRPRTRPVAMNPVDHPMGGGEGRASGGHPRSRNGIPAKGYKTRNKNKKSSELIISRRIK